MKQCRTCGEWKQPGAFRKGRRVCEACRNKQYREKRQNDPAYREAYNERSAKRQREKRQNDPAYREARNEKQREKRQNDPAYREADNKRQREKKRKSLQERWLKCVSMAGGVCQKCGQTKHFVLMDFHHVDPALKRKRGVVAVRQLDFKELDKCALLCVECHRFLTANYWDGTWRKRGGLGYELVEWWYTRFRDAGKTSDDPRWRKRPNEH